jgi:hypothetical protein
MVYDERSNYVGDTHWRDDSDFNEGEELELERGGILVEVGECVGKTHQDLSELVNKRVREREERAAAKVAVASSSGPQASYAKPQISTPASAQHLRPKSLNAVIGIPTGHYGRAIVSNLSPFEQKHSNNQELDRNGRPAKRHKRNTTPSRSGYAQNLLGASLSLGPPRLTNTQVIGHEPLKTNVRSRMGTLNITEAENEGSAVAEATTSETYPSIYPAKENRRRLHTSPVSINGHASSPSGATLALSEVRTFACANSAKTRNVSTKAAVPVSLDANSKTSTYQNSLTARPTTKLKPPEWPEFPDNQTCSSTLTSELQISELVQKQSTNHANKAGQDTSATRLMAEQPVACLRIRPRPPRKMMMLMGLARLQQQPQDEDAQTAEEPCSVSKVDERAGTVTTGSNLASSILITSDTNINVPRPTNITTTILTPSTAQKPNHGKVNGSADALRRTAMLETIVLADGSARSARNARPHAASPNADGDTMKLARLENAITIGGNELLSHGVHKQRDAFEGLPQPHTADPVITDTLNSRSESASKVGNFEATEEPVIIGPDLMHTGYEGTVSTVSDVGDSKDGFQSFETASLSENDRHSEILDTPVRSDGKVTSRPHAGEGKGEPEPPPSRNLTPGKIRAPMGENIIKPPPTSPSLVATIDRVGYSTETIQKAGHSTTPSSARLVNPSTLRSGRTIASNMINVRLPTSNVLASKASPSPRLAVRAAVATIKRDASVGGPAKQSISRGPWSRESFDLFGAWTPPERTAGSRS